MIKVTCPHRVPGCDGENGFLGLDGIGKGTVADGSPGLFADQIQHQ